MLIKICGLLEPADAEAACAAGVDLLGVIFAPARRQRTAAQARRIFAAAPAHVERVGVFVDAPLAEVEDAVKECELDRVQLGGRETPDYCAALEARAVKTLRLPRDRDALDAFDVPLFHLDAADTVQAGGTGQTWDYTLARSVTERRAALLSGGLTPDNVAAAIAAARPYGVDVSSGVETGGQKDPDKIFAFVANARAAGAAPR